MADARIRKHNIILNSAKASQKNLFKLCSDDQDLKRFEQHLSKQGVWYRQLKRHFRENESLNNIEIYF